MKETDDWRYSMTSSIPSTRRVSPASPSLGEHYGFGTFDIQVLFSSSVALAMRASAHDLSRRVRLLELNNFSFREYVAFKQDISLPTCSLQDLVEGAWTPEHLRAGRLFGDYLVGAGLLPFALEEHAWTEDARLSHRRRGGKTRRRDRRQRQGPTAVQGD